MRAKICFLLIFLLTFTLTWSQEKKAEPEKKEKPSINIISVKEVKPVPEDLKVGFESINGKDSLAYMKFLSSDSLEGRETTTPGYQVAAEFAATLFESWGLKPAGDMPSMPFMRRPPSSDEPIKMPKREKSFLQHVPLKKSILGIGSAKAELYQGGFRKEITFTPEVDYQFSTRNGQTLSAPVVFIGYGLTETSLKFDEYKDIDVKGKIVMMLTEVPNRGVKDSPFEKEAIKSKYNQPPVMFRRGGFSKSTLAMEKGAVAVLMVENSPLTNRDLAERILGNLKINDETPILPHRERNLSLIEGNVKMPWDTIPTLRISRQMADQILELAGQADIETLKKKIESTMKPASLALTNLSFTVKQEATSELTQSPNVLAFIEGSDPVLKDEVIVLGAHLDHLGKIGDYIYNGSDDNGSGSALILEVAQAFAMNPLKPKRTIVFALWTGEEGGLFGSRYYTSHPAFPLAKTLAYFNFDMVSRQLDKKILQMMAGFLNVKVTDEELAGIEFDKLITFSISEKASHLLDAFKENNQYVGMSLLVRESTGASSGAGGSDHASFQFKKVPWGGFMSAMTDDYHQTSDTYEKASVPLMQMTTRLAFLSIMSLANR